jgi:hypothetical protein
MFEIGLPLGETRSTRTTEQVLPEVTGRLDSESPVQATITIAADGDIATVVVDDSLEVSSVTVE